LGSGDITAFGIIDGSFKVPSLFFPRSSGGVGSKDGSYAARVALRVYRALLCKGNARRCSGPGRTRGRIHFMWQGLASMWRLAQIGHSRSSVINPLQWTLVIILIGLLVSIGEKAASWLLVFFAALLAATLLLLIVAYVYFMFRNPADLRSEKYSLAKTAMEKRLVGDSLSGLREVMDAFDGQDSKLLSNPENKDIEHSNG
jgi:hypothetical protein